MRHKFTQKNRKLGIKRYLILPLLMFISSLILPIAIAQTSPPTANDSASEPTSIVGKAKLEYQLNKFESAAALWQEVAGVYASRGDKLNQGMALSNLSLTYQQIGKLDLAKTASQDGLKLLESLPDTPNRDKFLAQSLDIQGNLYRTMGDSAKALDSWRQATAIYEKIKLPQAVAQSRINQAQAMQDLGLYPLACQTLLANFQARIPELICRDLSRLNRRELAATLNEGEVQKYLQTLAAQAPDLTAAVSLRSLAGILEFGGQFDLSEQALNAGLAIAQRLKSRSEQGNIYLSLGNLERSRALSELERGDAASDPTASIESIGKAKENYNKAIEITPSDFTKYQARVNLISLEVAEFNSATQAADKDKIAASLSPKISPLAQELKKLPASRNGIYLQVSLAEVLLDLKPSKPEELTGLKTEDLSELEQMLANAVSQAEQTGDKRAEAYALLANGQLYRIKQDLPKAEQYTQQGLKLISGLNAPEVRYRLLAQLGAIQADSKKMEEARVSFKNSVEVLKSLRRDLIAINPELQDSFGSRVEPIYRKSIEVNFKIAKDWKKDENKKGERNQLLKEARDTIESLQVAELNNFFREVCEIDDTPKQMVQIDPTAAIIYPVILESGLEILVSLPNDRFEVYTPETKVDRKTLNDTVAKVVEELRKRPQDELQLETPLPESEKQDRELFKQLYTWLVQPLAEDLKNSQIETLTFVPDGSLRNIPMAVLYDGEKYLAEKYALAIAPGLSLVNRSRLSDVELKVASAGLSEVPQGVAPRGSSFQPLPNVVKELDNIEKLGLSGKPLLNVEFTSGNFQQELSASDAPIIHLATHGQFSSQVENTFVLSWDRTINVRDLERLFGSQFLSRAKGIELLVLSACETAKGSQDNLRGALGLAGVAYRAGARSTVATLWQVSDEITAQFMENFYTNLKKSQSSGASRAQALRQAQTSLINDSKLISKLNATLKLNDENSKLTAIPAHFWAPYVLVGNWQ